MNNVNVKIATKTVPGFGRVFQASWNGVSVVSRVSVADAIAIFEANTGMQVKNKEKLIKQV